MQKEGAIPVSELHSVIQLQVIKSISAGSYAT